MNIIPHFTRASHDVPDGDGDIWGNPAPVATFAVANMATPSSSPDASAMARSIAAGPSAPVAAQAPAVPPSGDAQSAPEPSAPLDVRKSPIKKAILSDPAVADALAVAQKAEADFQADLKKDRVHLHPTDSIAAARRVLSTSTDVSETLAAAQIIREMSSPAALEAQCAIASQKWRNIEPVKAANEKLVVASLDRVEVLKADALEAEQVLFAAFNLSRERTGVSARLDACERELKDMLAGLHPKMPAMIAQGRAPTGFEHRHILDWFAVS